MKERAFKYIFSFACANCSVIFFLAMTGCVTGPGQRAEYATNLKSESGSKDFLPQQSAQKIEQQPKIYGVTVDSMENVDETVAALKSLKFKPTVRVVFDEKIPAEQYLAPLRKIHKVSFIMGELVDSYYMKTYSIASNSSHTKEYLDTLGDLVDIWEFGNEVNGEWLGSTSDVLAKIKDSYQQILKRKKMSALTLYYNDGCWEKPEAEMFSWAHKNIPEEMRADIDFVFVSYYEDDCDGPKPKWKDVFAKLAVLFPHSKLGFGEVGSKHAEKKSEYIKKYYSLKVEQPKFVGGYFWWYFHQDMVPRTKPLWGTLNSAMTE